MRAQPRGARPAPPPRSMLVPAWPPGPALALPPPSALVLALPPAVVDASCVDGLPSPPAPPPSPRPSRVVPAVGSGARVKAVVGKNTVLVLVLPRDAGDDDARAAEGVFREACADATRAPLALREVRGTLDELRVALWVCARAAAAPPPGPAARLAWKRGFARLCAARELNGCIRATGTSPSPPDGAGADAGQGAPGAAWPSLLELPALPLELGPDEGCGQLKRRRSLNVPRLAPLELPALQVEHEPVPLDDIGGYGRLQRRRSLNVARLVPLDFARLQGLDDRMSNSESSTPRAAAACATAALSRVRGHLFLGGAAAAALPAAALRAKRIAVIINLAADVVPVARDDGFERVVFHARDSDDEDLHALLPDVLAAVERARARGSAALVHCHRGVSRSAAAAAAAVMLLEGLGCAAALREVRSARLVAGPNVGFVRALQQLGDIALGHGRRRVSVLGALRNDRVDGGGQEVLREVRDAESAQKAVSDPFAVVVLERGADRGVVAARGPLVDDARWQRALWLARWIEHRDYNFAVRAKRRAPPPLTAVALHAQCKEAIEVHEALAERRLNVEGAP